ncbi:hypothetical protein MUJ63_05950 [Lachnospiraceae bacterium NSJ-143]|nr:hypothetical protein [Lachnospiraceae bacterium NSJ-143]
MERDLLYQEYFDMYDSYLDKKIRLIVHDAVYPDDDSVKYGWIDLEFEKVNLDFLRAILYDL